MSTPFIVFGDNAKPDKAIVAMKSKVLTGYEVNICGWDTTLMTMHFITKQDLDDFIEKLQKVREGWR